MAWHRRCRPAFGRALALLALTLAAAPSPVLAQAATGNGKKLQCWTDDRGQRACGDAVPPGEARRQRAIIDQRGVVKKVLPAQKSAAEIEAQLKAQRAREQAEAYDRYLLQAYQSVDEIGRARDERIAAIDARLRIAEKSLADASATLNELRQRAATAAPAAPAATKPAAEEIDPKLADKIATFTASRASQAEAVTRLRHERERIQSDFARDINRYRELRAPAPAATAPTPPAAPEPAPAP